MRIQTRGLGAHDQDVELHGNTVLSAPSESGKSSVLNAIRWVTLGFIPQQGKSLEASARLMRGDGPMSVTLTLDDGRSMSRSLTRNGRKLTMSATASWLLKAGTEVEEIRLYNGTLPNHQLSLQYGVSASQISKIRRNRIWHTSLNRQPTGPTVQCHLCGALLAGPIPQSHVSTESNQAISCHLRRCVVATEVERGCFRRTGRWKLSRRAVERLGRDAAEERAA